MYEIEDFYDFMVQIDGRKKENLGSWFSDASQPFNKYSHHSSVVKVSCIELTFLLSDTDKAFSYICCAQ